MQGPRLQISDKLTLDLIEYARTGWRAGVWASSGRGKSYAVGVIIEEMLDAGIPVVALDPEGEMWTLREAYRTLVIGGPHGNLPILDSRSMIREILCTGFEQGIAVIFDLSDATTNQEQQRLGLPVLEELFTLQTQNRRTIGLVIEEVQIFAPQSTPALTSEIMTRISNLGRKRGILLCTASQRTQNVSKAFISSLNFPIIGGFEEVRDYDAIKHHAQGKTFQELHMLPVGTFWFPRLEEFHRFRQRKVTHGGDTPAFGGDIILQQTVTDQDLDKAISRLEDLIKNERERQQAEQSEIAQLKRQVKELQQVIAEKDKEIEQYQIALKLAAANTSYEPVLNAKTKSTNVQAQRVEVHGRTNNRPAPSTSSTRRKQTPASKPKSRASSSPALVDAPLIQMDRNAWLEHPAIQALLRKARLATRQKLGCCEDYCTFALSALIGGVKLTAEDLATGLGLASTSSVQRMKAACRQLVKVGLATESPTEHAFTLNTANLQRAISLYEARQSTKQMRKRWRAMR